MVLVEEYEVMYKPTQTTRIIISNSEKYYSSILTALENSKAPYRLLVHSSIQGNLWFWPLFNSGVKEGISDIIVI